MDFTLYIEDQPVALERQVLEIKEAPNALQSLDVKVGAYSNRFTVNRSAQNQKVFEHLGTPYNNSRFPYQRRPAHINWQGQEIYRGFVKIEVVTADIYEAYFFGTNVNWFDQIKGKSIRDLDLTDLDHEWTVANAQASQAGTFKNGDVIYPVVEYGVLDAIENKNAPTVFLPVLMPAIRSRRIFEQIFKEAGLEVDGTWFNTEQRLANEFVPFSLDYPRSNAPDTFRSRSEFFKDAGGVTNKQVVIPGTVNQTGNFAGEIDVPFDINGEFWSGANYNLSKETYARLFFTMYVDIIAQAGVTASVSVLELIVLTNPDPVPYKTYAWNGVGTSKIALQEEVLEGLPVQNLVTFKIKYDVTVTDSDPTNGVVIRFRNDRFDPADFNFIVDLFMEVSGKNQLYPQAADNLTFFPPFTWRVARNLPDIDQADFVRDMANRYLLIISERLGSIEPVKFETLNEDLPNAQDWSERLVVNELPEIEYRKFELGQNSKLAYLEEDGTPNDSAAITVDDQWLVPFATLYESVFASSAQINLTYPLAGNSGVRTTFDLLYLPIYPVKPDVVMKIYLVGENLLVDEYYIFDKGIYQCTVAHVAGATIDRDKMRFVLEYGDFSEATELAPRITSLDFVGLSDSWLTSGGDLRYIARFQNVKTTGYDMNWQAFLDEYYPLYITAVNRFEWVKCLFRTTPKDLNELDFTKPVRVEAPRYGLSGYYYINALTSLQLGVDGLAQFELIKTQ